MHAVALSNRYALLTEVDDPSLSEEELDRGDDPPVTSDRYQMHYYANWLVNETVKNMHDIPGYAVNRFLDHKYRIPLIADRKVCQTCFAYAHGGTDVNRECLPCRYKFRYEKEIKFWTNVFERESTLCGTEGNVVD